MLRGFLFVLGALMALGVVGGYFALNGPATAGADYVVTKDLDGNDGVCNQDCSLREAIQAANGSPGLQTISVPAGVYVLTIAGTDDDAMAGDLDITESVIINAANATVDGNSLDRVLHVTGSATTVNLNGLTIEDGDTAGMGAGLLVDVPAAVQLSNCVVQDNEADGGGGGIANVGSGSLTVTNCLLDFNRAPGSDGAALYTGAGAVSNLNNCTASDGESTRGGATYTASTGVMIVSACSFVDNDAAAYGGAFFNEGQLFLTNTTTHENHAALNGGALLNDGALGIAQIDNSTLSFDTADFGAEVYVEDGTVVLYSTILRHTSSTACSGDPVDSEGYNLVNDFTCNIDSVGDIEGVDPLLAPLANYGGPTETHMLQPGSPAYNAGDPGCPPPTSDQRGVNRPQDGRCDIGAVEATGLPTITPTPGPSGTGSATPVPTSIPPSATATPTATPIVDSRLFGDMNCDGNVDALDALIILLDSENLDFEQQEPCFDPGSEMIIVPAP